MEVIKDERRAPDVVNERRPIARRDDERQRGAQATFGPPGFAVEARLPGDICDDQGELQEIGSATGSSQPEVCGGS